jgi:hypothetical protein
MISGVYPPDGPQTIGQVLDAGFRIFKVSLVRCLLFGALAMIAGQLPNIYSLATGKLARIVLSGDPIVIALSIVGSIATIYLGAAVLIRQREIAEGRRNPTRVELAWALRRLPVVLGVAVVSIVALGLVPAIGFVLAETEWLSGAALVAAIALLGVAQLASLWLVPGLSMAVVVSTLGSSGVGASLREGLSLAAGSWWRTMLTFIVWGILLVVFNFVVVLLIVMALPILGATDVTMLAAGTPVALVALRAIGLPFLIAILLAVYGALQVRRQGVDLQRRVAGMAQA